MVSMITVKDIREKEFSQQKHGYHEDEVDEFLDEIADQMEALIRENRSMMKKVDEAEAARARAEAALERTPAQPAAAPAAPVKPAAPTLAQGSASADDSAYFRNLEATLRETLLSAQRIADQTVSEAKKKAEQTMLEAQVNAESIKREAASESATLRATLAQDTQNAKIQVEGLKASSEEHKRKFRTILEGQLEALQQDEGEEA